MISYYIFETCLGWMAVVGSSMGVQRVILPHDSKFAILEQIAGNSHSLCDNGYPEFCRLAEDIRRYFRGEKVVFHYKLDMRTATGFQRRVWFVVRSIPYGQTRSYLWVAKACGLPGGARAVGQAIAMNPLPIIVPCHRVINSNGSLGGFSGGVELKRKLLEIEKCKNAL